MTLTHSLRRPKSRAWHAFFIALAMAFLLFLPFLIIDKGLTRLEHYYLAKTRGIIDSK